MPASRSAAAERLSARSMSAKSSGGMPGWYPRDPSGYRERVAIVSEGQTPAEHADCRVRIAATGDVHCGRDGDREHWTAAFEGLGGRVDLILLAGDLTTHGEPEQAAILADAARDADVPVLAVLGNHDWHSNPRDEVAAALAAGHSSDGPVRALRRRGCAGAEVGVAGCRGCVGGAPGSHMPGWGEPLLRE